MTLSQLSLETSDGIVYATLGGEIDMSNVQQIRLELGHALTNQVLGLVLDLTAVDYLDSAGIHLVHSLRTTLRSHGQKLALVIPEDSVVNDALRLAGVDWEVERIGSCAEAPWALGAATSGGGSAADP